MFKPGQRPAHRRGGEPQLPCRSRQRARLCDRNKRTDVIEIHVLHPQGRLFSYPRASFVAKCRDEVISVQRTTVLPLCNPILR